MFLIKTTVQFALAIIRDYMIALLVVVSIILKIHEEFCLKYLEGNGKK